MIFAQDSICVQVKKVFPKTLHEVCVSSDSISDLLDLQAESKSVIGIEGDLIPYSPRTDDGLAMVLLVCFFISSYVLARSKKFLLQQARNFMLYRERTSIFNSSTTADMRYLLLLIVQTCVLSGVCIFNYFNDVQFSLMKSVSPHLLLVVYIAVSMIYFLFKWVVYSLLGWVFFDKNKTDIWLESYSTLIYYLGFVLFPLVLFLVYFDLNVVFLVSIGCFLVIFTKILMFYKWVKLFFSNIYGAFLLILYFCALEIIPCLILYQGLVLLNNILIINF